MIRGRYASLAVVALCLALACGRGEEDKTSFASWDEFVDTPASARARPRPVVFVGVDGAAWDYMDRLVERGLLPNVARIQREGARATLRSVQSYVSPPAWTTMLTGYLPAKSGVYTFGDFDREAKTFGATRSTDALAPFVWEAAGRAGLRSAVVNVPMTYPVYPINGIMVSGLLTPIKVGGPLPVKHSTRGDLSGFIRRAQRDGVAAGIPDTSEPPGMVVENELNLFIVLLHDTKDDGRRDYDRASLHAYAKDDRGNPSADPTLYSFDVDEHSPWVKVRVRVGAEHQTAYTRVKLALGSADASIVTSETVFPITATFTYPEELADELVERFGFYLPTKMMSKEIVPALTRDNAEYASYFYDYDDWDLFCYVFTQSDNIHHKAGFGPEADSVYAEIDRFLGEMMRRMPADAVLMVGSDHGNAAYEWGVELNRVFEQMNLLERRGRGVDHEQTLVFHNLWHLYINHELVTREELARRGHTVPDGTDPVEFLRRLVTDACANIQAEGRSFPVEVLPMPAGAAGETPDMRVTGTYDDYRVEYWALQHPRAKVAYRLTGEQRYWHSRDGVLLMWGEGVKPGYDAGVVGIENVAPTISYFLGLPLSADMDGHVLTGALEDDLLSDRPALVTAGYRDIPREGPAAEEDREELEKKLRSLGYIK